MAAGYISRVKTRVLANLPKGESAYFAENSKVTRMFMSLYDRCTLFNSIITMFICSLNTVSDVFIFNSYENIHVSK